MPDEQSVHLLSFNSSSRNFAYKCVAQGLTRSLSAFTCVIREYLDPVMKANRCAQYVNDLDVAVHTASELTENFDHVFQQIEKVGIQLSIERCQFSKQSIEFSGDTNSTAGIAPIEEPITNFLKI